MKHAHYTGLCVTRYGDETNRHFVNSETVEKICELLIKHNGSIKPVLDIILSEGIYCTFGIIESIKSKETWVDVSDKYFVKDYFKDKRISDIERICESIVRHSGKTVDIVDELKDDIPYITNKFINSLKYGSSYRNITIKYFKPNQYRKQNLFTENQVIQICESIVKHKGDINRVYEELKDDIGDNLTIGRIIDIKGKGSYMNISNQYFRKGEFPSRVIDIDNIDFVRSLLILNVFKGSPSAVYDALNHNKYPKLTKSVVSMIKQQHPAYMKSNRYDLAEYYSAIEQNKFQSVSKELIDSLIASYNSGNSDITDESYDRLLEEYLKENGGESARPFNRQKQSADVNDIVGTLPKAYGVTEPWRPGQKTYKKWLDTNMKSHPALDQCKIILQPKFDGCSVALDFTTGRFFTRGDYDNGESVDVTEVFQHHLEVVKSFARPGTTAMKFEAILSHEQFLHYALNLTYKRPRDVVSATITSRNIEMAQFITLVPLRGYVDGKQYIPKLLNEICEHVFVDDFNSIEVFIKDRLAESATTKIFDQTFSIDGVVASIKSESSIDTTFVDPELEVAIKILNDVKETTLRSIEYQFGKQGRITPVAIFDTVKFCDDKISVDHATLSTLDRVKSMGLRHGDTVRIMYNIVPYFLESYHNGDYPIPLPTNCPICGAALDYNSGVIVKCKNPDCKGLKLGAIIRHAEKMRMVGLGEGVLTKLYDNEFVTKIEDLYDLRKWDDCIAQTEGFGYTSYDNMVKSVDKALSEATLARFLGALPFNDTDEKTWTAVIRQLGDDEVIRTMIDETFPDMILNAGYIPSVGKIKIQKIFDGYLRNKKEIQSLMSWIPSKLKPTTPWGAYAGRVCFTGFRDKDLEKQLVDNGYEVGGFTNDLKALIVKDRNFQSDKVSRAKKLNIPIYTPDEVPDNLFEPF